MQTPTSSVTANARSLPSRPATVPLADSTNVPTAMSTLPNAKRLGCDTVRRTPVATTGGRPRITRQADHSAPTTMINAETPEPTAANTRGATPKISLP